jgi:phosphatidylserine decarboxylase
VTSLSLNSRSRQIPLVVDKDQPWESKYSPKLTVRAKYEPYDALRQRFWRQYMAQYDADDTKTMSYTELTAMLDSLGSTLTAQTIEGYFSSCGKNADGGELTFEEVVKCLETEVTKDRSQKAKVKHKGDELAETGLGTPSAPPVQAEPASHGLSTTGPAAISSPVDAQELAEQIIKARPRDKDEDVGNVKDMRPGNQRTVSDIPSVKVERSATVQDEPVQMRVGDESGVLTPASVSSEPDTDVEAEGSSSQDDRERVINIRTCPLCHRPRLGKRSEQDIVTHLAICASADWERVDKIVTANYVTSSQAQRKFFTKLVNKVAIGAYSLGANSANILVQDRRTGQLQEEKMAVYVRLGIRVLYKGAKGRMEGARGESARRAPT